MKLRSLPRAARRTRSGSGLVLSGMAFVQSAAPALDATVFTLETFGAFVQQPTVLVDGPQFVPQMGNKPVSVHESIAIVLTKLKNDIPGLIQ